MSFRALAMAEVEFLRTLCGPGRVFADGVAPAGVRVEVASTTEVARIMKYAFERGIPVTQVERALWGRVEPGAQGGFQLDLSAMTRILELDGERLALTVEPGALLGDIAAFVEDRQFFYPWDPQRAQTTLSSLVNSNAAASPERKDGVTRDHILGLEVVLPNGEIMELGGKDPKNSSGHALKELIVGSGGTLGIVTRAILRLAPLPRKALSLLAPFPDPGTAMGAVARILQAGIIPTAIEHMGKASGQAAAPHLAYGLAESYLQLSFDGDSHPDLQATHEQVSRLCLEAGALAVLLFATEERRDAIWAGRALMMETIKTSLRPATVAMGA